MPTPSAFPSPTGGNIQDLSLLATATDMYKLCKVWTDQPIADCDRSVESGIFAALTVSGPLSVSSGEYLFVYWSNPDGNPTVPFLCLTAIASKGFEVPANRQMVLALLANRGDFIGVRAMKGDPSGLPQYTGQALTEELRNQIDPN